MSSASRARKLLPKALLALAAQAVAGVLLALVSEPADAATTFTVNRTGDAKDRNINNDTCDTSRKRGKQCTLRAAIQEANDTPGADVINFNIGSTASVKTISPARPLPDITDPVTIDGYTQRGASSNTQAQANDAILKIQLNGTNAGSANGLVIEAANSTIKGLVINRFAGNGVLISGSGATGNNVLGNFIGTNASGTGDLGNGDDGVFVFGDSNTVGGSQPDKRNVISGNDRRGIFVFGFVSGNKVEGNLIGTDAGGTGDLGNTQDGVFIQSADNTTVGGTAAGTRNVISGNDRRGVVLFGATGTKVEGNRIGTDAGGTGALGNTEDGVFTQGAEDNTIGGTTSGAGNLIAHNGRDGVFVFGSTSVGNRVLSNQIFGNTGLGIDLGGGGVTTNDTDDPDTGANNLQNFPVITSAGRSNTTNSTTISGTINSNPQQFFTIQCFVADGDPSGHGEGQTFLVQTTTSTNANGDGNFVCITPDAAVGQAVTATATNTSGTATGTAIGDTSEFSQNVSVVPGP